MLIVAGLRKASQGTDQHYTNAEIYGVQPLNYCAELVITAIPLWNTRGGMVCMYMPIAFVSMWSEWRDSNPRPRDPKSRALSTALHPDIGATPTGWLIDGVSSSWRNSPGFPELQTCLFRS